MTHEESIGQLLLRLVSSVVGFGVVAVMAYRVFWAPFDVPTAANYALLFAVLAWDRAMAAASRKA